MAFVLQGVSSHWFQSISKIYSKALGNGYSISACVGEELFKKAASEVFLTGSCWNDSSAMVTAFNH